MQRIRLVVSGRVQGVGFRQFVCRISESLHLVGYAKNLADGTVEVLAEGEEEALAELEQKIRKAKSPLGIMVEGVEKLEARKIARASFASFSVAY
ncbi:MAG: acylphosphatase [Candidatus Micrarchaeota archaeon]|nr:acylphosphatase [Candidatus Micrarchaeota archaeon]